CSKNCKPAMLHCDQTQDLLLDFVYGVLEEPEQAKVRAHVHTCATCQSALKQAQVEQKTLSQAARAVRTVPEFAIPQETQPEQPPEVPAPTLPFIADQPVKRSFWRRPIVRWAAAAAILLAVVAPFSWHRYRLESYQKELTSVRTRYQEANRHLTAMPAAHARRHQEIINKLHAQAAPHLHVVGPTTLQPGAAGYLHITTRHPEGPLVPASVRVKLTDAATGDVVKVKHLQTDNNGQARAEIEAGAAKPNSNLNLIVEADTGHDRATVREMLHVSAASHVVRIDTNKNIYQTKDVLFFRVLVLDRHTLQPPTQPIEMHVELRHNQKTIRSLEQATGPGGIIASEFAIEEKFAEGEYTLLARAADPKTVDVRTVSVPVEVVRDLPGIRLDPNRYVAGSTVTGDLVLRGAARAQAKQVLGKVNGKPVPITLEPQAAVQTFGRGFGGSLPSASGGLMDKKKAEKGKKGNAPDVEFFYRFSAALPKDLPKEAKAAELSLQVPGNDRDLNVVVPLTPTEFAVDFYPEGGDLIAGVKNRVYFRVRAKNGEPVTSDGRLILWVKDNDDLQILVDEPYELGMGQFEFTPNTKDTYTVRVTTPTATAEVPQPFAKLGIRSNGVVLHVAKAVGNQEEPIRMTLRQLGPERKLLLVAQCRGQVVDERWVNAKKGSIDLTLDPTPDARGMIRITAFEIIGAEAIPVAERLIYRASTHRLDLSFTPNTREVDAGSKMSAKIRATDETGQPAAAWILGSVVDERFQTKPRSLSAHFLLMNEIRDGSDLDQAEIVLHDSPASAAVLERFLGTHGWRRYVAKAGTAKVAAAPASIFSRESMPLAAAQKRYEEQLAQALTPIRKDAISEEMQLRSERERLAEAAQLASANLADFENNTKIAGRLALGGLVGLLFAVAVVLMGLGTYRIVRAHRSATPAFGGAFACLVVCLTTLFAVNHLLGPIEAVQPLAMGIEPAKPGNLDALFAQQMPNLRGQREQLPTGAFSDRAEAQSERRQLTGGKPAADSAADHLARAAKHEQLAMNLARARDAQLRAENPNLQNRFNVAKGGGKAPMMTPKPILPEKNVAPPPLAGAFMNSVEREFAHIHTPGLLADTLLWHPNLWLENGVGDVRFEVGSGQVTYRVLLLGHSANGRFGFFETRLDATGANR
ncbi:MAG TPA: zf-HC2 domain-containing protein, partial [Gemmataceae bacterium]|nr:zf-HC2 domain-containing protein [Gemmataceae bacterium]